MLASRIARRSAGAWRSAAARSFSTSSAAEDKVLLVLYEGGEYATPDVLGCVENELGIREFVESRGHELVVTADKNGAGSTFEKELPDADIVISQPFWPAYLTPERIAMAPKLKLAITAGVGSDHVDLGAAAEAGMTVTEVTGSNVVSVAEHVVMSILAQVRNFVYAHDVYASGGWNIAACASRSWDLEGKHVGTVAMGRIGRLSLERLAPFGCHLHAYDPYYKPTPEEVAELNLTVHNDLDEMLAVCDVVTINSPLTPETEDLFDAERLAKCKPGMHLVNTARGKIVNAQALRDAVESGHIRTAGGDVSYPQPPPADHPWRTMPWSAHTPHISGTSIDAQKRYAKGVRDTLEEWWAGKPINPEYVVLDGGKMSKVEGSAGSAYVEGGTTSGAL